MSSGVLRGEGEGGGEDGKCVLQFAAFNSNATDVVYFVICVFGVFDVKAKVVELIPSSPVSTIQ